MAIAEYRQSVTQTTSVLAACSAVLSIQLLLADLGHEFGEQDCVLAKLVNRV
jgi:hypothetical protein